MNEEMKDKLKVCLVEIDGVLDMFDIMDKHNTNDQIKKFCKSFSEDENFRNFIMIYLDHVRSNAKSIKGFLEALDKEES